MEQRKLSAQLAALAASWTIIGQFALQSFLPFPPIVSLLAPNVTARQPVDRRTFNEYYSARF